MITITMSLEEYDMLMKLVDSEEGYAPSKADEIVFAQLVETLNGVEDPRGKE